MPWMWTDELARLLLELGAADPRDLAAWLERPFAVAVPPGADPRQVAGDLLTEGGADHAAA